PSAWREGNRRGRNDCVDLHGLQRRHRRAKAVRCRVDSDAADARARLRRHVSPEGSVGIYSANFDYHRARSLADAQKLLAANPGAKLLAGGHSLIPLMKLRL